jgi:hypothetical protein
MKNTIILPFLIQTLSAVLFLMTCMWSAVAELALTPTSGTGFLVTGNLDVTGDGDIRGNELRIGSLTTNGASPGMTFAYEDAADASLPSLLKWTAHRSPSEWIWERTGAEQNAMVPVMKFDSQHRLALYSTENSDTPTIVLDPVEGRILVNGVDLVSGDSVIESGILLPGRIGGGGASLMGAPIQGANGATSFGTGCVTTGVWSTAFGISGTASGAYSMVMGFRSHAQGEISTAIGIDTIASGTHAIAMGAQSKAQGLQSMAMGASTTASGIRSTAMGMGTAASGDYSTAMGLRSKAQGEYSTAMGIDTVASG